MLQISVPSGEFMRICYYCLMAVMGCAVFSVCTAQSQDAFLIDQRKLGREFTTYVPSETFADNQTSPGPAGPAGALTLQQALADGLMHSPDLAVFAWDVRAAEARELQAALLPNPELVSGS